MQGVIFCMHTLWSVFAAWEVLFPAGSCVTLAWPASPPWVAQALWLFCIPHHNSFSTSPHSADFPFLLLFSKRHQHNAENVWQAFGGRRWVGPQAQQKSHKKWILYHHYLKFLSPPSPGGSPRHALKNPKWPLPQWGPTQFSTALIYLQ